MNSEEADFIANSFRRRKQISIQTEETAAMLDIVEQDMNKFRIENLRLTQQIKQLQEQLVHCSTSANNTSSKFMLPSEFKQKYESMVKETLPSAFGSLFDQPKMLVQVIQSSCLYLEQSIRTLLTSKTQEVGQILGIQQSLFGMLQKLYQDNYTQVLSFNEALIGGLKSHLKVNIKDIDQFLEEDNEDLIEWMKQYWLILSYIVLSDQEINIGFSRVTFDLLPFQKNEYYCVDGFGKDGVQSLVILPPVMRKNQPYNGVKHAVLILKSDFDCSIFKEEDQIQELRSYNSPKQITVKQLSEREQNIEECRIKPHYKQPVKSVKETLKQFNQFNNQQSFKEFAKLITSNQGMKRDIQQRILTGNQWSKVITKKNKENSQHSQHLNSSQNCSFRFTIQQFIKKIQIDGNRPLRKHDTSFQDSFRLRAQSNDGKCGKYSDSSLFKI